MYAKIVNNELIEAPKNLQKEDVLIIGYNLDCNSDMLLSDGYKLVKESEIPVDYIQPVPVYKEENNTIFINWEDAYKKLSIEEQNKAIQQARQRAYEETSDNLFMEYQEALARGDLNADEKRLEWLTSKDKVREDNPYIGEVDVVNDQATDQATDTIEK